MSRGAHVTESVFKGIKFMLRGGATVNDILASYPVSMDTIRRIRKVNTFDEYLENQRKKAQHNEPEKVEPLKQQGGTLSAGYQINRIYEALKEQNEILRLLSNKVAFIVDELTN